MNELISYMLITVSNLLLCTTYAIFLKPRFGWKSIVIFAVAFTISAIAVLSMFHSSLFDTSFIKPFLTSIIALLGIQVFFHGTLATKIFTFLIGFLIEGFADFISILIIGLISNQNILAFKDPVILIKGQCIYVPIQLLLVAVTALVVAGRRGAFTSHNLKLFILFPITQLPYVGLYYTIVFENKVEWVGLLVLLTAFCVAADLMIFHAIKEISQKAKLEEQAKFYEQQLEQQLEHYEVLSSYHEKLHGLRHDFKNQVQLIQSLIARGETETAEDVLRSTGKRIEGLKEVSFCENQIINALLYIKSMEMRKEGIEFVAMIDIQSETHVEISDLCRIFSNVLDNSLEACLMLDPDKRYVQIKAKETVGVVVIKAENPMVGSLNLDRAGLPRSSKNGGDHGQGMKIIKGIVEKYNGDFHFEVVEGIFSVSVSLMDRL